MNIYELAMEYGHTAELLRGRIHQLEQEKKLTEDEETRLQLDGRIRPLRAGHHPPGKEGGQSA